MTDEMRDVSQGPPAEGSTRSAPTCERCGEATTFAEGISTHDLYAEKFLCPSGHETYRSFGRGSVS
ncbi:MAG: hypothetical protein WEB06_14905 [Actinomycetota bacterium]